MNELAVVAVQQETDTIRSFELANADGSRLPPFAPGSHVDVLTPNGLVRQYSLFRPAGNPEHYRIGVLREARGRGGSASLCDTVAGRLQFHETGGGSRPDYGPVFSRMVAGAHAYYCGPAGFMAAVEVAARQAGVDEAVLYREFFSADGVVREDGPCPPFELVLARSGKSCTVGADESAADALRRIGVDILTSCEQGVCGTCATRVLQGTPDHRYIYLSAQEHRASNVFMPCCSRARSAQLLLDL